MISITGSIVALATPMLDDGAIDYPVRRRLVDWHVEQGTDCIVAVGTTGESPTVSVRATRAMPRWSSCATILDLNSRLSMMTRRRPLSLAPMSTGKGRLEERAA